MKKLLTKVQRLCALALTAALLHAGLAVAQNAGGGEFYLFRHRNR